MSRKNEIKNMSESMAVLQSRQLCKALIMAGGFGSRMGEITKYIPKPMLPLQGKPILEYAIELCKLHEINDISISIFHLGDRVKEYFREGNLHDVKISYVEEKEPLGTAGAIRLHKDWLDEPFMMCNADELKDIDLHGMYKQHIETKALATIALTKVEDPSQYGVVQMEKNKVLRFVEKPKKDEAPSNLINAGLYIINPEVVAMIPEGYCMMEKEIFPKLAEQGKLFGFAFEGQWFDTGTMERYNDAERNWDGFKVANNNTVHFINRLQAGNIQSKL